ncbi:MAG: hypothetical protein ABSG82_08690 [Sedimentisphaerales bacterium]|jgi:hypothetical protein
MKIKKALFYLLAGILAGCVPVLSLHPLFDNQNLTFNEKLLGTFTEPNNVTWEFARSDEPNAYQLTYSAVSEKDQKVLKGLFTVHLVKLDGRLFMDIYPKELPWADDEGLARTKWPYNTFFMLSAHVFAKVEIAEPQVKLWLTDVVEMKELLKENPDAVKHEVVEDNPVLTASTQQLQSFVLKYANDKRLFANESILTRKTSGPAQGNTAKDVNKTAIQPKAPTK